MTLILDGKVKTGPVSSSHSFGHYHLFFYISKETFMKLGGMAQPISAALWKFKNHAGFTVRLS